MNYALTISMSNNGKVCKVTSLFCNTTKQANVNGATSKMLVNATEVFKTNSWWGTPTASNLHGGSMSEMESTDESNTGSLMDIVLTFRRTSTNGAVPKTTSCKIENVTALDASFTGTSAIPELIAAQFTRLAGLAFSEGNNVYLANAILTFHD